MFSEKSGIQSSIYSTTFIKNSEVWMVTRLNCSDHFVLYQISNNCVIYLKLICYISIISHFLKSLLNHKKFSVGIKKTRRTYSKMLTYDVL